MDIFYFGILKPTILFIYLSGFVVNQHTIYFKYSVILSMKL